VAQFNPVGLHAWVHPGGRIAHRRSGCRSALGRFQPVLVLAEGLAGPKDVYVLLVMHVRTGRIFLVRNSNVLYLTAEVYSEF